MMSWDSLYAHPHITLTGHRVSLNLIRIECAVIDLFFTGAKLDEA